MSDDLIKRSDAIEAIEECLKSLERARFTVTKAIESIPSVDIPHSDDWEKYSDKLWKNAYERGKADRPQGEWIEQEDCWQCSECGDEYVLEVGVKPIDAKMHFCPNCGARMFVKDINVPNKKGADDERV